MVNDASTIFDEFIAAVEASVTGNEAPARLFRSRYPSSANELDKFTKAVRTGRLVKTPAGYRLARKAAA